MCSAKPGDNGRVRQHRAGHDGREEGLLRCQCNASCSLVLHGCFCLKMFRKIATVSDPPTGLTVPPVPGAARQTMLRLGLLQLRRCPLTLTLRLDTDLQRLRNPFWTQGTACWAETICMDYSINISLPARVLETDWQASLGR